MPAQRSSCRRTPKREIRPARLRVMPLEDRCVPANIVVNIAGEDPNPGHGMISFRDALAMANSDHQANTITFAPGITTVTLANPAPLFLNTNGQAELTIIDGGGVVTVQGSGVAATGDYGGVLTIFGGYVDLRGLTITGGIAANSCGGGALSIFGGNVTLENVTVKDNVAAFGGGIVNAGSLQLTDCTIAGNRATATGVPNLLLHNGSGGGIDNEGNLVVQDSSIYGNSATTGGGIATDGYHLTLEGSTVYDNTAAGEGGGIYAIQGPILASITLGSSPPPTPTFNLDVSDTTISGNSAGANGGGIYTSSNITQLTNVTITSNRANTANDAGYLGGGLYAGVPATVNNSTISGNFNGNGTTPDDVAGLLTPSSSNNVIGKTSMLGGALPGNGGSGSTSPTTPATNPAQVIVAGSGAGGQPRVNVYNPQGGLVASFLAFSPNFTGGVHVAVADINGDGVPDVIVGAGAGGGPEVIVFDGTKLGKLQANGELESDAVIMSFYAYAANFTGGVSVAVPQGTGVANPGGIGFATGAGPGGGPQVNVYAVGEEIDPGNGHIGFGAFLHASFFAYAPTFNGGVNVAVGDVNGDGTPDVITGAGPGGGPHVKVFNGASLLAGGPVTANAVASPLKSFYAYSPTFSGGVTVAVGDINGDGKPDIVTGAGPGMDPLVEAFDFATLNILFREDAYNSGFTGGVNVATAAYQDNTNDDIVTGAGPGGGPHVEVFQINPVVVETPFNPRPDLVASFFAFDPTFLGGVFVG